MKLEGTESTTTRVDNLISDVLDWTILNWLNLTNNIVSLNRWSCIHISDASHNLLLLWLLLSQEARGLLLETRLLLLEALWLALETLLSHWSLDYSLHDLLILWSLNLSASWNLLNDLTTNDCWTIIIVVVCWTESSRLL